MKVIAIKVSFGGTVNIGSYSNIHPSVQVEAELQDGDDVHSAIDEAFHIARTAVLAEVEALDSPQKQFWLDAVRPESADNLAF